jgi:ABC-type multidrug transport system ATPase subunit
MNRQLSSGRRAVADRIVVIDAGKVIAEGSSSSRRRSTPVPLHAPAGSDQRPKAHEADVVDRPNVAKSFPFHALKYVAAAAASSAIISFLR